MSEVRIWKFPAVAPGDRRIVGDLLYGAGRYYNKLVEIERDRIAWFRAVRRELAPELAALEEQWARLDARAGDLVREAKRQRQAHFRRSGGEASRRVSAGVEEELAKVQAEKKALSKAAKPLRAAFNARLKEPQELYKARALARAIELAARPAGDTRAPGPRTREIANREVREAMVADPEVDEAWRGITAADARALEESKAARAACGLPPGCYLQVEEAFGRAKKDSGPDGPRFRRNTGEGKIAVQLRSTTWADLLTGTSMLQLSPAPRIEGKKGRQELIHRVRIRVGSRPDRSPIWLETTARIDRQPPPDTKVVWAWLRVRRQGERMRWELQLTLKHPELAKRRPPGVGDGGHIRIGWGGVEDGVCVATWPEGALVVPHAMLERAERSERLLGHADTHRDTVERVLRLWMRRASPGLRLPQLRSRRVRLWVREHIVTFARQTLGDTRPLWRAWVASEPADLFAPLSAARAFMRSQGFERPEEHLAWWLLTWHKKDRHLRQWSVDARKGFENARDALFRETAIRLATQYATLSIDSYSVAKTKELPSPLVRHGDVVIPVAQHRAQLAAPGRFREILLDVMGPRCDKRGRPSAVDELTQEAQRLGLGYATGEGSGGDQTPDTARTTRNHDGTAPGGDAAPMSEATVK